MKKSLKTLALASLGLLTLTACSVKLPSVEELLSKDKASTTVSSQSSSASSTAASSAAVATISQEEAINSALELLGVSQADVTDLVVERVTVGSGAAEKAAYEINFTYADEAYTYLIDGQTGEEVTAEEAAQTEQSEPATSGEATWSADDAKAVALYDFGSVYGVGEDSLSDLVVNPSNGNYDISFAYAGTVFTYTIDGQTGDILGFTESE